MNELNGLEWRAMAFGMPWNALVFLIKKTLKYPKACPEKRSAFCQEIAEYKAQSRNISLLMNRDLHIPWSEHTGTRSKERGVLRRLSGGAKGRTNVIGALLGSALVTVSLFQTTINTTVFNAWVVQDLIPKLPEKSVVVMDNATFHKSQEMAKALQIGGHTLLFLPPYSPDLNPIEKKWAEVKAKRRSKQCAIEELFKNVNF